MSTPTPSPASTSRRDLKGGFVAESLRVVSAHSRHFLALSLLFVRPLSSLLLLLLHLPSLLPYFNPHPPPSPTPPQSLLRLSSPLPSSSLAVVVAVFVIIIFLLLLASAAISHNVRSGFFGCPVCLLPALSTLPSIPRLILTLPFLLLPLLRETRPGISAGWRDVAPVVASRTVLGLAVVALLFLYWMVRTAVMYLYCKAVHGELADEIAQEFAHEYVCLPFDEGKVPRVVSVVRH